MNAGERATADARVTASIRRAGTAAACALALICAASPPAFGREHLRSADLAELSLEELANLEISSVSRRRESIAGAPSSVYVITAEDIRRSGATTLAEVLRLAPNLQVAQADTVQYAITARGFNNTIGNKLLVLIDGRSIYTPLYSGVFWDMQEVVLENIERVEVISGPGATTWGVNAVNGVINVITKNSEETQGSLLSAQAGNEERGFAARWGGNAGPDLSFRINGSYRNWGNTLLSDGTPAQDGFERGQVGFRADWRGVGQQAFVHGRAVSGESGPRVSPTAGPISRLSYTGASLMAHWTRELGEDDSLHIHASWSHIDHENVTRFVPQTDIYDIDLTHRITSASHRVVWGAGLRHATDTFRPGLVAVFMPESRELDWQYAFVQDDMALADRFRFIAGLRLEWNDYTGLEYLPNLRLAWEAGDNELLWAAYSRAVRSPSRFDRDVFLPAEPPFLVTGGPDFRSEIADVYELGYRGRMPRLNFSATLFYHDWDELRSGTPAPPPLFIVNNIRGESYGLETWATWQVLPFWRVNGGFWAMEKDLEFEPGTSDTAGTDNPTLHNDPGYQLLLGMQLDVSDELEMDLHLRHVDDLDVQPVPAYTELNARLAWLIREDLELSLIGRNLLHARHPEFGSVSTRSEIGRSIMLGFRWSL